MVVVNGVDLNYFGMIFLKKIAKVINTIRISLNYKGDLYGNLLDVLCKISLKKMHG